MTDKTYNMTKLTMDVDISGLETCYFCCGERMKKYWAQNNITFTNNIGNKFGQNVKASMLEGELIAIEVDDKLIPKLKTEADKKTHAEGLLFLEQELYEKTKDN